VAQLTIKQAFDQALALQRLLANRTEQAAILQNMGVVYSTIGQTDIAHDFYARSLSIYREAGDHPGQIKALQELLIFAVEETGRKSRQLSTQDLEEAQARLVLAN